MKPLIGIVPSIEEKERQYFTMADNVEAIKQTGGIPVVLPYIEEESAIAQLVAHIDGLYLAGGNDVDPSYFGEEPHPQLREVNPTRDAFEVQLVGQMVSQNKPVLGICKGCQIINIALGGDIYQDIKSQMKQSLVQHQQKSLHLYSTHMIDLVKTSQLHRIIGKDSIRVNSRHHQAIRTLGKDVVVSSHARDGLIESIESTTYDFVLGVQWHPESLLAANDAPSLQLYTTFIKKCQLQKSEKE